MLVAQITAATMTRLLRVLDHTGHVLSMIPRVALQTEGVSYAADENAPTRSFLSMPMGPLHHRGRTVVAGFPWIRAVLAFLITVVTPSFLICR